MAIQQKLGLSQRLSQRLILTPSLQQAIKLLPLTTLELAEVLEQEVTENPLLEEVPLQETLSTEEMAQEERKDGKDDPLADIDVEKFFEDYLDDREPRRPRGEEIPEMPGVGEVCPLCNEGHLVAKRGRFGPFVGCDRYPECRYIKKSPPPESEQFGTCPQCGQGTVVTKRARRGRRAVTGGGA